MSSTTPTSAPTPTTTSDATPREVYLEADKEIPGQHYVCMSFLSPEKVLANKDVYFFNEFVKDYEVQYKIRATETFLMDQMKRLQDSLSKATDVFELCMTKGRSGADGSFTDASGVSTTTDASGVSTTTDASGVSTTTDASGVSTTTDASGVQHLRLTLEDLSGAVHAFRQVRFDTTKDITTQLEEHIKSNMKDMKTTTIQEDYEAYLAKNKTKLEEDFFSKNSFRTTIRGLKIRGTYDTYQEALGRAKTLQRIDPDFNVYVGQVGFWLPWDPDPNNIKDQEYADEQLNQLMKRYKDNEAQRDEFYETMKRDRVGAAKSRAPVFGTSASTPVGGSGAPVSSRDDVVSHSGDMFSGADLALARKRELAASSSSSSSSDTKTKSE
jgi:hypothetical protein